MNTRLLFAFRTLMACSLALALLAAIPAGASFNQALDGLAQSPGWAAFRPPRPGIMAIVAPTPNPAVTTEAGGSVIINVSLDTDPGGTVTVPVASSDESEGTVSTASLTFDSTNYTTPQPVTVLGQNDAIDDGNVAYTVNIGPASAGDNPQVQVALTNNDDADTFGITVNPISGLTTSESGTTASFTVVLTSEPIASVTIGITSGDSSEGSVAPASLTFNNTNWSTARSVTVTGVDDDTVDGNITYTVTTVAATSTDPNYSGFNPSDVSVTNTDDDVAGITVTPTSGLTTTEAGGEATFTVQLNTAPNGTVTIDLSSDDEGEGTVDPLSLTFNGGDWNTPKPVTVTGVGDDIDDGNVIYHIVTDPATGTSSEYVGINAADVTVTNTDDDTAGITVTPTTLTTTEATGDVEPSFSVVLTTQPSADVVISSITSGDTTEGTVSTASLTFTSDTWNIPQSVTVTGVPDDIVDGNITYTVTTGAATSTDPLYSGFNPSDVSVTNTDADVAGITVTPTTGLATSEAGVSATFTVILETLPSADVTIGLTSSNLLEGGVTPATLTFTPINGTSPQTVTVTGVDDFLDDGDIGYTIITDEAASTDPLYNLVNPSDVSVTNTDNDTAGITLTPAIGLITDEAGTLTAPFTVALASQPAADVVLALASSDDTEGTVSPATMTFPAATWNIAQTATVTGVDDKKKDGSTAYTIDVSVSSTTDPIYLVLPSASAGVTNTDDDTPGITVAPITGLFTTESFGTASFSIVLNTEPNDTVTIGLSSDNPNEGTLAVTEVIFTIENWETPQEVIITGADDTLIDGDIPYTILTAAAVSAGDTDYNTMDAADVSVTNQDNDVAGFLVDPINGLLTFENGSAVAIFSIALDTQPTADVSLTLQSDDTTEGSVSPASLTFTPSNWAEPQEVTVTGKNDNRADGSIIYHILTNPATSDDDNYDNVDADDVEVTNVDDDTADITLAPINIITTEGELPGKINAVLNTEPEFNVTFTFKSDDTSEGVFFLDHPNQPVKITFTPDNWNTIQIVNIYGVDDLDVDGESSYTIQVTTQSDDLDYDNLSRVLSATNQDAPTIGWVLPENHDPYYETASPEPILLGVEPVSDEPILEVIFYRYDRDLGDSVRIGEDSTSPYQFYLNPQTLDANWNQIYAYAWDMNRNTQSRHELLRIFRLLALYLPSIQK